MNSSIVGSLETDGHSGLENPPSPSQISRTSYANTICSHLFSFHQRLSRTFSSFSIMANNPFSLSLSPRATAKGIPCMVFMSRRTVPSSKSIVFFSSSTCFHTSFPALVCPRVRNSSNKLSNSRWIFRATGSALARSETMSLAEL